MTGRSRLISAVYRTLGNCVVWSLALQFGPDLLNAAETYSLVPNRKPGELTNVEVVMQVGGDLLLGNTNPAPGATPSVRKVPMSVAAKLVYDERATAIRAEDQGTSRAVRHYYSAKALVEIQKGEQQPSLRDEHRLIAVDATAAETTLVCPQTPLTREELDLLDVPANTLLLDEFLPASPISVGASWKHSESLLAALLRLDAVSLGDVQSMLAEIDAKEQVAKVSLAGTVHGAIGGVATEIELKAKYTFDLRAHRIVVFALLIKEKRSIGHVGPGLEVVAKQIVKIKPITASEQLGNEAVAAAEKATDDAAKRLVFESPLNRFRLEHDRRWFATTDDKKLTVFRLVDRGELVAQCNVATLDVAPSGEASTLAHFQRDIEKSLGDKFGQFVTAKEETDSADRRVFRVVATGKVSELPIQWVYYLYTTSSGQRLSVAFTMEQSLIERFAQADRQFLSKLQIASPQTAAAVTPTPATR